MSGVVMADMKPSTGMGMGVRRGIAGVSTIPMMRVGVIRVRTGSKSSGKGLACQVGS